MKTLFIISTDQGGMYFALFYTIAFVVGILIIIYEGYRKKYPMIPWLIIVLTGALFGIIGSKLFTCSQEELKLIFTELKFPATSGKTALGGILGLMFGVFFAAKWLRLKRPVFDNLAIALPLAMAIQRVGCLIAGCCFGKPTEAPWGIEYGSNTLAFHTHLNSGLVHAHDPTSLVVHPTQLYQVIGCLLIALIVWRSRKYWKSSGSLFLFSVALYGCLRFSTEFFRDPIADGYFGEMLFGLKQVQWCVAGGVIIVLSFILNKERNPKKAGNDKVLYHRYCIHYAILLLLIFTLLGITKNWLDVIEKLTIHLLLIPALFMTGWEIYKRFTLPQYRWLTANVLILGILFMGQTFIPKKPGEKIVFNEVSIRGITSTFHNEVKRIVGHTQGTSCSPSQYYTHKHTLWAGGIGYSRTEIIRKYRRNTFGINMIFGIESEKGMDSYFSEKKPIFAINPNMEFKGRAFGFNLGFLVGDFKLENFKKDFAFKSNTDESGYHGRIPNRTFIPQLGLHVGPYDLIYL